MSVDQAREDGAHLNQAKVERALADALGAFYVLKRAGLLDYCKELIKFEASPEFLGYVMGCVATEKNFVRGGALKTEVV